MKQIPQLQAAYIHSIMIENKLSSNSVQESRFFRIVLEVNNKRTSRIFDNDKFADTQTTEQLFDFAVSRSER